MKIKLLGVLTAGAALLVWQAQALPIPLVNASFELPGTGQITTGWNSVPGWFSGGAAADSGVQYPWPSAGVGVMAAYSWNTDAQNGIWANQTTSYQLAAGDNLYLGLLARCGYTGDNSWMTADATLHYELWTVQTGGPGAGVIYDGYFDLGSDTTGDGTWSNIGGLWANYQTEIPAAAISDYIGQTVGITLFNSSGGVIAGGMAGADPAIPVSGRYATMGRSWVGFDYVQLGTDITDVPEPGTIALLTLGGLGALVAIRHPGKGFRWAGLPVPKGVLSTILDQAAKKPAART